MKKGKDIPKLETIKTDLLGRIDELWIKFNRDRKNSLYINECVKEHLVWTGAIINNNSEDPTRFNDVLIKGHIPFVFNASEKIKNEYQNSLFKSPDSLFNIEADIDEKEESANIFKHYILKKIDDTGIINSYMEGSIKRIERGEIILFHQWDKEIGKRRIAKPVVDENGNSVMDDKGMPDHDWTIEEYIANEGVTVKAIEPMDFCFDTTKIPPFTTSLYNRKAFNAPSCIKIIRSWMSINDIENNELFNLSNEDKELLKMAISERLPKTEQNYDDFTDRFAYRYINGDMIEILEAWGTIRLSNNTLEDFRVITAASKVVLRYEKNPYTKCPIIWMPYLVDRTTRRGISPLVPAIYYNAKATEMLEQAMEAREFSLNPAFIVSKGTHIINGKKKLMPGDFVAIDDGLGNGEMPQEIQSYKNIPMTMEFIKDFEQLIQDVTATTNVGAIQEGGQAMTATQTNQIVTGSNTRFSSDLLDFCNYAIIPSLQLIATMIAENTDMGTIEKIKISDGQGNNNIAQVTDETRNGKFKFTIGSTQAIIEQKSKFGQMMAFFGQLQQMGAKLKVSEIGNLGLETFETQNPERFFESDPLEQIFSQMPPPMADQMKQQLAQLAQNPQQLQQLMQQQQQMNQPQPQIVQVPTNKVVNDLAAQTVWQDSKLTEEMKEAFFQQNQIIPPQEIQIEIQNNKLKLKQKSDQVASGHILSKGTGLDISKGI